MGTGRHVDGPAIERRRDVIQTRRERRAIGATMEESTEAPITAWSRPRHPRDAWDIRPVEHSDLADLKRLFLKLHRFNARLDPRFALAADWERHLGDLGAHTPSGRPRLALLAREGGQPAGFVLAAVHHDAPLWRHRTWAEVEALYVEPSWRGAGLADALLERACAWAAGLGMPVVQLYVTASNSRAIRFYERQGFRPAQAIMRAVLPDAEMGRAASTSAELLPR
jgi:GNAT superfamily N-acetyltransferase